MARIFSNWLREYTAYTKYSESPDLFHFWTATSVIAGALRRRVWIDQRYFQWTPNFYIVLVGPPGVAAKSTSVRIGLKLLESIDGIKFGPQSMTWQGLTLALEEAKTLVPHGAEGEFLPMSCITCAVKELGTFLRPEDDELVSVLIDLWDGQLEVWRRKLKTQTDTLIENPWINVIGCTTPAWLRDNFPESMAGGGLVSRMVFVYGDKKRHFAAYPADLINEEAFSDHGKRLLEDLNVIAQLKGEYELTPEAKAWGNAWYEKHWTILPPHLKGDRFGGYIARKQTHIHKVAMVLAAAKRDELYIDLTDMEHADGLVTALEDDMQIVFRSMGVSSAPRAVGELLSYIRAYGKISQLALWRHCMPIMSYRDFQDATKSAMQAGYIRIVQEKDGKIYYPIKPPEEEK